LHKADAAGERPPRLGFQDKSPTEPSRTEPPGEQRHEPLSASPRYRTRARRHLSSCENLAPELLNCQIVHMASAVVTTAQRQPSSGHWTIRTRKIEEVEMATCKHQSSLVGLCMRINKCTALPCSIGLVEGTNSNLTGLCGGWRGNSHIGALGHER
jgi:hypothetical protein